MKLKNLLFAAAFAGLFSACSNEIDDIVSNNDNSQQTEQGEAYASFSFLMPNAAQTRADGVYEVGSSDENQITNVGVYMFNGDVLDKAITLNRASFSPDIVGGATLYTTKVPQEVNTGTFKVYVIVNPTANLTAITEATTLAAFQAFVEKAPQTTGEYCTNNKFMMTNAEEIVETTITKANNIKNPALASVNVERIAAKITFTNANTTYPINGTNGTAIGSVKFDAYKVINTRNSAYNLRRVGDEAGTVSAIGGAETKLNYVIENIFTQKMETFATGVYTPNYSRKYNTYVAFRGLNATGSQTLAYALENTMKKEAQLTGYSTAVIFRAKVALDASAVNGTVTDGNLYRYLNTFHASLLDLVKSLNPNWKNTSETDIVGLDRDILGIKEGLKVGATNTITTYFASINNITTLKKEFSVDYFVGGNCYYTTWFRHNNDGNSETMGIMEYAMVRNNVYKLSINTVNMIGEISSGTPGPGPGVDPTAPGVDEPAAPGTNPEIPGTIVPNPEPTSPVIPFDPELPVVSTKTYLNMSIEVLRWTVRDNSLDL